MNLFNTQYKYTSTSIRLLFNILPRPNPGKDYRTEKEAPQKEEKEV